MESVKVTVQTEQRMEAITSMANAIYELSKALGCGTHVAVSHCNINTNGESPAVVIDTAEEITETIVSDTEEDR